MKVENIKLKDVGEEKKIKDNFSNYWDSPKLYRIMMVIKHKKDKCALYKLPDQDEREWRIAAGMMIKYFMDFVGEKEKRKAEDLPDFNDDEIHADVKWEDLIHSCDLRQLFKEKGDIQTS